MLHVRHNKLELTLMYIVRLLSFRRIGTTCGVVTPVLVFRFFLVFGEWTPKLRVKNSVLAVGCPKWMCQVHPEARGEVNAPTNSISQAYERSSLVRLPREACCDQE